MANFISIFRIFVMFYAAYLIYACEGDTVAYIWALALTIIAFALDGVDGYVARKFNEESKFGALLDIMGDRIVENTYWILFAVMGWINILFPLIAITRGFVTDTIRSAAMEQGLIVFSKSGTPEINICYSRAVSENVSTQGQFTARPAEDETIARGFLMFKDSEGNTRVIYAD